MGFLSSLLSIGGSIVGNMILPGAGGAIGGELGGAIGGAVDQSGAAKDAASAQINAQREAIAARQLAASQVAQFNEPFLRTGYNATNALNSRLGLPSVAGYAPATNPLIQGQGQGQNALLPAAANGNAFPSTGVDLRDRATGLGEGTVYPDKGGAGPQTIPATPDGAPPVPANEGTVVNALSGQPVQSSGAPTTVDPGTYGSTSNPTEPTAGNFSYGLSDYQASPALAYQLDQARKATLASASATGALQSGAALKALQDRAQNLAYQDFTNERAFSAGQFNTNRNFDRSVYENNRGYLTSRFDTQTGNLFRLQGSGQNAATVDANAAVGAGSGIAASDTAIGNAAAGNALQQGQIGSNLAGNLGGIVGSAFQNYTGRNALTPMNTQTAPNFTLAPPPATSAAFVNPLPSYSY